MSRPDLSGLPRDVRVRIAVARAIGWTDLFYGRSRGRPGNVPQGLAPDQRGRGIPRHVPRWLTDPSAIHTLQVGESVSLSPREVGGWIAGALPLNGNWRSPPLWRTADTPGAAVCAAVLARYGIDWETLEGVQDT